MGKKLMFVDVMQDEHRVQVMIDLGTLQKKGTYSTTEMDDLRKRMTTGDYYGTCKS
jgi:hypothetical protein